MVAYSKLSKLNHETGEYEVFFALRAVGLAYELGHKLALQKKGVLALTWEDLRVVSVSGKLRLTEEGGRVRCLRSHQLHLQPQDARLAHTLVLKHLPSCRTDLPSQGVAVRVNSFCNKGLPSVETLADLRREGLSNRGGWSAED